MHKGYDFLRNIFLGIGIGVLLPSTVYWGMQVIMKQPNRGTINPELKDELRDTEILFQKNPDNKKTKVKLNEVRQKLRKEKALLDKKYNKVNTKYEKRYFYIMTLVGLVALIIGGISKVPFIGMGFIIGGIICITHSYWSHWYKLTDILKFISLLIALIILIFFGYRIFFKEKKSN